MGQRADGKPLGSPRYFVCEGCRQRFKVPGRSGRAPKRCDDCAAPKVANHRARLRGMARENERLRAEAVMWMMRERNARAEGVKQASALRVARRSRTMAERKRDSALQEVAELRAKLRRGGDVEPIRRVDHREADWQEVVPDYVRRARRLGSEPGRDAVLKAIRLLRYAEGAKGTAEALRDLAAACVVWAENLTAPEPYSSPVTRGERESKRAA